MTIVLHFLKNIKKTIKKNNAFLNIIDKTIQIVMQSIVLLNLYSFIPQIISSNDANLNILKNKLFFQLFANTYLNINANR